MNSKVLLIVVLATAVGVLGAAPFADASAPATHTEKKSRAAVLHHWTKERMRHAKPMAIPRAKGVRGKVRGGTPKGQPGLVEGTRHKLRKAKRSRRHTRRPRGTGNALASFYGLELPWRNTSYGQAPSMNTVGRLYFRGWDRAGGTGRYDSYCTGTLVAPNLVITAAHCVREGIPNGMWSESIVFAPRVDGASQPYGRFAARTMTVKSAWYSAPYYNVAGTGGGGYYAQDYAFVVLNRNASGQNAGDLVGWYGLYVDAPANYGNVYHLGYPGEGGWNGCSANWCKPWQCSSPIQRYTQYAYARWDVGMSCKTTGGASGGPWFQVVNGRWYVTSVLSHMGKIYCQNGLNPCPSGQARYGTTFFGPYLDNETLSLYNYAKTL